MTSSMIRNGPTAALKDEISEHSVIVRVGELAKGKPSQALTAMRRRCFEGMTLG